MMQALESISDSFNKVQTNTNQMKRNGETIDEVKIIEKTQRTLDSKFRYIIPAITKCK